MKSYQELWSPNRSEDFVPLPTLKRAPPSHLLRHHTQHLDADAVELIEASPGASTAACEIGDPQGLDGSWKILWKNEWFRGTPT